MADAYDFVIVGAGSAGSVLAARLSAEKNRVLLLEAGPRDTYPWIHVPLGYGKTMFNPKVNWCSWSAPVERLNGRKLYCPRGKCLGGTSSINGMLYVRGQREDYDAWARLGASGWEWERVFPYFLRLENHFSDRDPLHATGGPIHVSPIRPKHPLVDAFIESAGICGIPLNEDFNGATQEGAGYYDITTKRGRRISTAVAYLRGIADRANLRVETGSIATRVNVCDGVATGVTFLKDDVLQTANATKEVIVCAGAIGSPQLLQLSGIGPRTLLESHGIPVVTDLQGVGENLQDHFKIRLMYECNRPISTNDDLNRWHRRIKIGLLYLLKRTGPLATGINQAGAFVRSGAGVDRPDIQFTFGTLSADLQGGKVDRFSGFTMMVLLLRPESRGFVRIRSRDPHDQPEIQPNYLSEECDLRTLIRGAELGRRVVHTHPLKGLVAREHMPGESCHSDEQWMELVRARGTGLMHPCGTCKIGQDEHAVVDEHLRVRGISRLRVADASVMPTITSGNTNTPTMMIAEKAADVILGYWRSGAQTPIRELSVA